MDLDDSVYEKGAQAFLAAWEKFVIAFDPDDGLPVEPQQGPLVRAVIDAVKDEIAAAVIVYVEVM